MFPSKKLGIVLDSKLNFNTCVDHKIKKYNKLIGLLRRHSVNLPQKASLTIYKSFIRPHLDYGKILYDETKKENSERNRNSLVECLSWCNTKNFKRKVF